MALKTLGLLALMAKAGLFLPILPADGSHQVSTQGSRAGSARQTRHARAAQQRTARKESHNPHVHCSARRALCNVASRARREVAGRAARSEVVPTQPQPADVRPACAACRPASSPARHAHS